jgi:hydrogenase-4 membrane subunit HyfE
MRAVAAAATGVEARECCRVFPILFVMLGIVVLAVLVVVYVAFPHRGHEVPLAPGVGEAMRKGVNLLPTLDNQSDEQKYESASHR